MRALLALSFPFSSSMCVGLTFLCLASPRPASATDAKPFTLKLPPKPETIQMRLDPRLTDEEKKQGGALKCVADGIVHIRDGKLQICWEDKWHDVLFQR